MEKFSELLIRSTLHDLANVLAGVKGILDLNPPGQPMILRDRQRLEAVLEEGVAALERSRHLAMDTLPERVAEPGPDWRARLLEELAPLGTLFRSQIDLAFEGAPECDQWAGQLLRSYVKAVTRQVLPQARNATLCLRCRADQDAWRVGWSPVLVLPENLAPGADEETMDICGRWARRAASALGSSLEHQEGFLWARIPRAAVPAR
jgi:hypothetical protein